MNEALRKAIVLHWKAKLDTCEIARRFSLSEADVYNWLSLWRNISRGPNRVSNRLTASDSGVLSPRYTNDLKNGEEPCARLVRLDCGEAT